jgi:hypothetical protein
MSGSYRWIAWNLTSEGWHCSQAVDNPTEATRFRPADTLLALLQMRDLDHPDRAPTVSILYRSPDADAVADAIAKFGRMPTG